VRAASSENRAGETGVRRRDGSVARLRGAASVVPGSDASRKRASLLKHSALGPSAGAPAGWMPRFEEMFSPMLAVLAPLHGLEGPGPDLFNGLGRFQDG
jgi:hypothetical protein